jgi:predicted porin
MTTSNIGIKASEDLGNGRKAVVELSSFLHDGTGATLGGSTVNTFARSAFVGLSDAKLGTVTLGRQSNPSFLPTILFNAYGDSSAYGPLWHATYFGNTGNASTRVFNDTAWDNSVAYSAPAIAGVKVTAITSKTNNGQNVGANAMYFKGPVGLTAYYQRTEANSTGSFQSNIYSTNQPGITKGVGASYDAKIAKLFATYQTADSDSANIHGKTWHTSALVPVGTGKVMLAYADSKVGATTYKEYSAGYDYPLSKKTDAYVTVGRADVTGQTQGQTLGTGLRVRF